MATSPISVLGLGSENMLNQDMIDSLKEAQTAATITPVEFQQEVGIKQKEAVENVKTKVTDLHTWVSKLTDPTSYEQKDVYTNNTNVLFEINDPSIAEQTSYSMEVIQLAQRDVYQTNLLTDLENQMLDVDSSLTLTIDGRQTTINMTAGATYVELMTNLNNIEGIEAEFVRVNTNDEYRLKIRAEDTGLDNAITFDNISTELETVLGLTEPDNYILNAQNSIMSLDGVLMSRAGNEINDIIPGMTMTIYEVGSIEAEVKNNITSPVEAYNNFILEYNALMETVDSYRENIEDSETSLLLGLNEVSQGMRGIKSALFSFNENADRDNPDDIKSMFSAGFDLNQLGEITTNTIRKTYEIPDGFGGTTTHTENFTFEQMLGKDPEAFKAFFTEEGSPFMDALNQINRITNIDGITNEDGSTIVGSFEALIDKFTEQDTKYTERIDALQEKLDLEYEQMAARFAQFDTIINNMTSAFSSLQMIIDQSVASN